MSGELLEFSNGAFGMAQNLESNDVGIIILGDFSTIREGDEVKRTGKIMEVPVGEALIGRRKPTWSTSGWSWRYQDNCNSSS